MELEGTFRKHLEKHLLGGEAFLPLDEILKEIDFELLGVRPKDLPYSFYEVFYHIWFTQRDILEYCLKQDYTAPGWPNDYWPREQGPKDPEAWNDLQKAFFADRKKLQELLSSEENKLLSTVPSHKEHTFLREILLVIEHNAYHSGQLIIILRLLGLK